MTLRNKHKVGIIKERMGPEAYSVSKTSYKQVTLKLKHNYKGTEFFCIQTTTKMLKK
jgi:hypothetical protein